MRDRDWQQKMKEIHHTENEHSLRPEHRDELEHRLLVGYQNLRPRNRRWLMLLNFKNRTARFAVAGLAMLILGVGACSTSTTSEVDLGQALTIEVPEGVNVETIDNALSKFLETKPEIQDVTVTLRESVAGGAVFELVLWGKEIAPEQLVADLRRAVPALADSDIGTKALSGSFRETYANKIMREVFMFELDGETEIQVAARIMAGLKSRGLAEGVVVDVRMTDDATGITIDIRPEDEE